MAYDARQDRLKPAIPNRFRPAPDAAGALTSHFRSAEALALSIAFGGSGLTARERFDLGQGYVAALADGVEAAAPSFMLSGAMATARERLIEHLRVEKERGERFALGQAEQALSARLAALDAELAAIKQDQTSIADRRNVIAEQLEALDDVQRLRKTGKLNPRDPAHARLLRAAGITDEVAARDDLPSIIVQRRRELHGEDDRLETRWNANLKRRDELTAERNEAADALAELQRADTLEAHILAERRAATSLGQQQLATAAYDSDRKLAKLIAADAIVSRESEPVRAASTALTRDAVSGDPSIAYQQEGSEFTLDEKPSAGRNAPLPKPI